MASLRDLLNSGMPPEEINALLSQGTVGTEGFQQSGFMGGEPYMPPPEMPSRPGMVEQAPLNMIRNNSTGRTFAPMDMYGQPSQSQPAPAIAADWARPVDVMGAKGHWASDNSGRIILRDGRIVEPARDTGAERARMKEDLWLEKQRAELNQLKAPPESAYSKELAKRLAEADAAKLMAKTPGTPEYERVQKQAAEEDSSNTRRDNAVTSAVGVLENINNARGKIGWASTGLIGQGLRNFGGTDALSLDEALEPVRASLSFDRLQRMREESKTGGALGQVAVQELNMLQKSMASLNTAQNEKDLNRSLDVVQKHYSNYVSAMQKARANGEFSGQGKSGAQIQGERQFAEAKGMPPEGAVRRIR